MKAKETSYENILKSNIVLFLCYGMLTGFLFVMACILVKSVIQNVSSTLLSVLLALICGILIFHLLHFIAKSSTLESFKKNNLNKENSDKFIKNMNLFFVLCMIFSVVICLGYLIVDNLLYVNAINQAYEIYEFISYEFAQRIANYICVSYQNAFLRKIFFTIIVELSLVTSFFSLIPFQKKLLSKYNKIA